MHTPHGFFTPRTDIARFFDGQKRARGDIEANEEAIRRRRVTQLMTSRIFPRFSNNLYTAELMADQLYIALQQEGELK